MDAYIQMVRRKMSSRRRFLSAVASATTIGIAGCGSSGDPKEYLEIQDANLRNGKHYPIVTGTLVNISERTIEWVQIKAYFYNKDTTMGSRVDNMDGRMPPGNKYNFEIDFALADQRATDYELELSELDFAE
jgi:hypothetical protein